MQNWLCGELLSLRKRWKWPLGFNTALISCICREQEHLALQGLCYFPFNRKLAFYYSELRAEIWADVAVRAPAAPAVFPGNPAALGVFPGLHKHPSLTAQPGTCNLQTADSPLQEAELPQKFWELHEFGKGWQPH